MTYNFVPMLGYVTQCFSLCYILCYIVCYIVCDETCGVVWSLSWHKKACLCVLQNMLTYTFKVYVTYVAVYVTFYITCYVT